MPSDIEIAQAAKMQHDERKAADDIDAIGLGPDGLGGFDGIVGINPLDEGGEETRHEK